MALDPGTLDKPIQRQALPLGQGTRPDLQIRYGNAATAPHQHSLPCRPCPEEKRGVGQAPRGPRVPAMHHSPCQRDCESSAGLPPKWLHLVEPFSRESQLQTTVSYVSFFRVSSKLSFPGRLCVVGGTPGCVPALPTLAHTACPFSRASGCRPSRGPAWLPWGRQGSPSHSGGARERAGTSRCSCYSSQCSV